MPEHTIAENLQRLQAAKTAIGNAITTKGGTVSQGDGLEEFASDIGTIPSGGGVELSKNISCKPITNTLYSSGLWAVKTWNENVNGADVWTDGENIYYSSGTSQYVLDKTTSTWNVKTWNENVNGANVWTDGENIYFSADNNKYILDKATSTWNVKTWGWTGFMNGRNIWTDGTNIYYSDGTSQYVLDKSTSTWSTKTWSNLTNFYAENIWTDGANIYHSRNGTTYILVNDTWVGKTWVGISSNADLTGSHIWTDGDNIYYSAWKNSAWHQYELKIYKGSNLNKLPSTKTRL